jgi:hypothetical protein
LRCSVRAQVNFTKRSTRVAMKRTKRRSLEGASVLHLG